MRSALFFLSLASAAYAAPDWKAVQPILAAKCYSCHGGEKTKGDIDLKALTTDPKVTEQHELWEKVQHTIAEGEMPPAKAKPLTGEEPTILTTWVSSQLDALAAASAGDPGPVTMRRLTNAEYDFTTRDLTGRDYDLAKSFQADGGGGEGFSNTGDVLFTSPAALTNYLSAARKLADHASILPGTGITFHAQRIGLRGPEQVKAQTEQGLYVWYQQKATPLIPKDGDDFRETDYMIACWEHLHQKTPLDQLAKARGLTLPFLQNWWTLVNSTEPKSRFLDLVRVAWRGLPSTGDVRPAIERITADLRSWKGEKNPGSGVQRRQQDADGIRSYPLRASVKGKPHVHLCIGDLGDGNAGDIVIVSKLVIRTNKGPRDYLKWLDERIAFERKQPTRLAELEKVRSAFGKHPQGREIGGGSLALAAPQVFSLPLPADSATFFEAEGNLDMKNPNVDQATIQWTATTDAPRNVTQIMPGVLTIWKRNTPAARSTMNDFNVMKTAFPDMFERRLEVVADNLYRRTPALSVYYLSDDQLGASLPNKDRDHLLKLKKDWGYTAVPKLNAQQYREYDKLMLAELQSFARKAWRRPIAADESKKLDALYLNAVAQGLDRESSAREVLTAVLVSPNFLFKAETLPLATADQAAPGIVPLGAHELASRLSYFLWSSMPDWELRKAALDGSLTQPEVLAAHTQRMLKDPRASALATEFAGQWLKFNGFIETANVDAKLFPEFTPELRADMQRECTEFFTHLFREDRSVLDIITGDTSFLNERLGWHYGVPNLVGNDKFREVKVRAQQRGGLLGMGAMLTKTSRPHRTSPVLRGDYLYQVLLGFHVPPPPANVPQLKDQGVKPASLRETLMKHRADQACSVCHDRIDPLGFALEAFDPIGRYRPTDPTGAKIDDSAEMKDGTKFTGLSGLRDQLAKRSTDFTAQFSRKLLGYALGRQTMPSDKPLITKMQSALKANDHHVSAAILEIVQSPQFLNRRP